MNINLAMCCLLAVKNNVILPTINLHTRDAAIDPRIRIEQNLYQQPVNAALNNSFGFVGHIVSTLFQKYQD